MFQRLSDAQKPFQSSPAEAGHTSSEQASHSTSHSADTSVNICLSPNILLLP